MQSRDKSLDLKRNKSKTFFLSVSSRFESLISIVAKKHKSLDRDGQVYEISSYSETKAARLWCTLREQWIKHNLRQLSRVYPKGSRVDSSNLDPVRPWSAGAQLVALNFQTGDEPMQLNFGRFMENRGYGYVLRPAYMRETGVAAIPILLNVKVLSCQRLPNNRGSKKIADVFCKCDDFLVHMNRFLDSSCCLGQVALHTGSSDSKEFCTEVVMSNGFNPCFSANTNGFDFEVAERDCSMLRFSVWNQDSTNNEFIGHMSLPVSCIRQGYRHVPLFDAHNGRLGVTSGLLCQIAIEPF